MEPEDCDRSRMTNTRTYFSKIIDLLWTRKKKYVEHPGKKSHLHKKQKSDCHQTLTILHANRQWNNIFKILKRRKSKPRILYAGKLTSKYKSDNQTVLNCKTKEMLFPWALPEESTEEYASDNQNNRRHIYIKRDRSIRKELINPGEMMVALMRLLTVREIMWSRANKIS